MPPRWLFAVSAAAFALGVASLAVGAASCGGGGAGSTSLVDNDPGTANTGAPTGPAVSTGSSGFTDGGEAGAGSAACSNGTTAGCPCTMPGAQVACGQVHRVSGGYVSCSPGTQTCDADGQWGDCLGDRVGDPRGPDRGFILDDLQLDASACVTNPCDPSCQSFVDTASGVDAGPDSGLVWKDAGVSLAPVYPDSGAVCSHFSISPLAQMITVTYLPKSTDPPSMLPTVMYSGGQQYTATALPAGCFTDVVPALWGMDRNDIGTFDSTTGLLTVFTGVGTFTPINIGAFVGGLPAQFTTATITVNASDVSAASTFGTSFATAGTGSDPGNQILYPYDGTVLPLGLPPPIVQWNNNGAMADAVKITLRYPDTAPVFTWSAITSVESPPTTSVPGLETATALASAPRYPLDATIWNDFEQTAKGNAKASGLAQPAIVSVQRIYAGHLYPEQKVRVYFAPGQLKGKVYYQSYETQLVANSDYTVGPTSYQVGGATLAITPGAAAPTLVAGTPGGLDGSGCRVCHTLSGDGSTLLTQTGSSYGSTKEYNLATGAPLDAPFTGDTSGIFAWAALSPGADYAVSHSGPNFAQGPGDPTSTLYNMSSGAPISGSGLGSIQMAVPSFSPDAHHITFNGWSFDQRSLATMDVDPATMHFTNAHTVYTPGSGYAVWPTYTPGSDQIVFGTQYSGSFGWTAGASADLWRYDVASGSAARMNKANGVGLPSGANHPAGSDDQLDFEPTMNPTPVAATGGFAWVVFTSRRLFGNVATLPASCSDARGCFDDQSSPTPKKLWMAAVNPTIGGGTDPSSPAFYLPGQELLAGNSRGFWVLDQCKGPGATAASACDTDLDCCQSPAEERCVAANSIPPIKKYCTAVPMIGTCAPDNTSCTMISQCCGALTGSQCVLNTCTPPPSLVTFSGASFTRDYVGTCDPDFGVVWRFFSWQSYTPGNSFIQFTGQTAATSADIVGMTPPPVNIGKAQSNIAWPLPAQTPDWTSTAGTVDDALRAVGQTSNSVLRVTAYLNPATAPSQTPVLEDWRATYDCVANK